MKQILFSSACSVSVVIGSLFFVQNRQAIATTPATKNPDTAKEFLPVVFPDNSQSPPSQFVSREQILSTRVLPDTAKNLSLQLMPWGRYATSSEIGIESPDISQARQVWVLVDQYAEYYHPRLGLMQDAKTTSVFDAETGEFISSNIVGVPTEIVGPSRLPATLVVPFDATSE